MSLKWKSGQIRCLSWKFGKGNLKESASWQQNQRVRGCREPHASQDCEGAEKIESRGWESCLGGQVGAMCRKKANTWVVHAVLDPGTVPGPAVCFSNNSFLWPNLLPLWVLWSNLSMPQPRGTDWNNLPSFLCQVLTNMKYYFSH